ncbi:F-box/WD repeat-containing protein 7 [Ischnura elegans]|uniref:F-box/WD repeat-containing protein 7 n=1 Tax=Ischnura elegans TaxID=197161 RepID=UPI001ED8A577|nr:F-box/WD repeat-containing protein 7 [Ischnura elegans]XP_046390286.1 F-box/WD repeat-containing protein 7 [Ischnura elegans]
MSAPTDSSTDVPQSVTGGSSLVSKADCEDRISSGSDVAVEDEGCSFAVNGEACADLSDGSIAEVSEGTSGHSGADSQDVVIENCEPQLPLGLNGKVDIAVRIGEPEGDDLDEEDEDVALGNEVDEVEVVYDSLTVSAGTSVAESHQTEGSSTCVNVGSPLAFQRTLSIGDLDDHLSKEDEDQGTEDEDAVPPESLECSREDDDELEASGVENARSWRKRKLDSWQDVRNGFPCKKLYPVAEELKSGDGEECGESNRMDRGAEDGQSTEAEESTECDEEDETNKTVIGSLKRKSVEKVKAQRSVIPSKSNPPPEMNEWLLIFQRWGNAERLLALDRLIERCEPTQVRHMMQVIEPQFQRDFISLLPKELALYVLSFLEPRDLVRAAQTCRYWRLLTEDNLLWREKCREAGVHDVRDALIQLRRQQANRGSAPAVGGAPSSGTPTSNGTPPPYVTSPWKAAYMRQHTIEMNWRVRPLRPPKVLKGHDDHVITCLQFSGNRIVSGSDDNTLKVWSATTGKCLRTLVGHTGGVWSSQMSGSVIISGSTDRTLKVWNAETGLCVHTLYGHTSTVRCMHLHGKKVVSGSRDATLRVWHIESGECLHVLVGHIAAVRCVQYDGRLVVSGAYDYMVKVWNPEREECLHTLEGHTNRVYSLQFDGVHVVSGSLDTSIRVWEVETGACRHTLMGHQSLTSGMELRHNILVSGNADSTVKVWDILTGHCLQTLSGPNKHQSAVTCLQFNSKFVITSSDDGTVKLWDVKTGEFIRNLVALGSGGSGGVVWRIRANDTKLVCAVGSRNGTEETKLLVLDFEVEAK